MPVNESELDVRLALPDDADQIFRMAGFLATSGIPERHTFDHVLSDILDDPRQLLLVAQAPHALVGYLHGFAHPAFHANGAIAVIEEVFVESSHRRLNCGRALVAEFEDWAKCSANARYVAAATRRAHAFYLANGYTESADYFKKVIG